MAQFTHLHVHTQYSILDGAADIKQLVKRASDLGMGAIAITDHGNMFGAKLFHQEANKVGVKPILGCEAYVADKSRFDKNDKNDRSGYHLVLLAKNEIGYHNLARLASYAYTEGFYYKPRIDWELLEKYSEGLICSSACLGGEIPQAIMSGNIEHAKSLIKRFVAIFGGDFYLELQLHPSLTAVVDNRIIEAQQSVNKVLLELGTELGVKCIASNDVHFIFADDAEAHDHLICLNTGRDLNDPDRMRYTQSEFLKSADEMSELFPDNEELLSNTMEVAEKVENYSLSHEAYMPNFPLPDDFVIELNDLVIAMKNILQATIDAVKSKDKQAELQVLLEVVMAEIEACKSVDELDELTDNQSWDSEFKIDIKYPIAKQFLYLKEITFIGATRRYGDTLTEVQQSRIDFELETIEKMGFPGYFLIVWDFIRAAREMDVAVGPGRGSAAGSVVAYCLAITNIDPLPYDLLFERFLNPERVSMPDVDVDFDEDGRAAVMQYVVEKYGSKRVAHIITFGTMAAKMAIKDVARVQQLPLFESNRITKLVPDKPGTKLAKAYKEVPELAAEKQSSNPLIKNTLRIADRLEGAVRQTGVHACGVIIAKDDLENFIPLSTAKDADLFVVQYDGKHVEDVGLLKMDFLGLRTLSIIKDAVENVKLSKGIDIDIDTIPIDDKLTYELYSRGDTTGLFQFESGGMKKYLRDLRPNRFEDLIAMAALYRPGPIEYIPDFISRKHGLTPITYDLAPMEEYLADTYGITVYQEQVMLLSQSLAGFTKGQADTLRKAMGKKQIDILNKLKDTFLDGAVERGHDRKICEKVWTDWEKFASYAFNKSHSTCYALVSYQTGYLKAHHPCEFMAALLSRNLSDIKKIGIFMDECRRMGIPVKCPDVNHSYMKFSVDKTGNVRFGLAAIKGVGEAATLAIIKERKEHGEYKDIFDFVERVNLQSVSKKTVENLIYAGALDDLSENERGAFFTPDIKGVNFVEHLFKYGNSFQNETGNNAASLFSDFEDAIEICRPKLLLESNASNLEILAKEKELVGIYLSAHPLDSHRIIIDNYTNMTLEDFGNIDAIADRDFTICGMVTAVFNGTTKKGDGYGRITIEDFNGSYEFMLFSKDYELYRNYCHLDYQLFIKGSISQRFEGASYSPRISSIMTLREAREKLIKEVIITVPISLLTSDMTKEIERLIEANRGDVKLFVKVFDNASKVNLKLISKSIKVDATPELFDGLKNLGLTVACH